jgi:hypothetical protein
MSASIDFAKDTENYTQLTVNALKIPAIIRGMRVFCYGDPGSFALEA